MIKHAWVLCFIFLVGCPASNASQKATPLLNPGWENMVAPGGSYTAHRAAVPDGWMVYVDDYQSTGFIFVPDAEHQWLKPTVEGE